MAMVSSFGDSSNFKFGICQGMNVRGIPKVKFIDDVVKFLDQPGAQVDEVLKSLQELLQKYKVYEVHITRQKSGLNSKIPEIEESLEMIKFLKKKAEDSEEVKTEFKLSDNVYADSIIDADNDTVGLWLGAGVMLEYTYDDATALLTKNLEAAKLQKKTHQEDLDFLKDQIVTTEVSIARVYNHDVKIRREMKGKEKE
uniref:Prefoldin subunit 3 n=2 Tax=Aplanochytrium stocchinoi TaxID=215587 RepID=A0A7S3LLU8_9STRA|mmetsp:Transcript_310/g.348  ORF Transcript_310/g.348 Transcript_310/m.348 type:complete len:198 (-) Transcript_310:186-779(-)|eukprot:CAMPEP_0204830332 /NCGR_PEP_ID=MMETSP1346-20131115/8472_1 /ASSEMBLY_ACC=CAM_ASM_000771 /TAXON_ID=215587 /ORGANISM="Aplanochytrium stocchinoi, Strain GSBS06" /LENGTH=197 /DNA_ID=CAMNT_0051960509 /DNA_START=218 /DNA_END=811 /DNA_ORIENTATION=+